MSDFIKTVDILGDDELTDQIIQRTVTEIKDDVVTTIGERAFQDCINLAVIDFPNARDAGNMSFYNCSSLTAINLPNLVSVGSGSFQSCYSLPSIKLERVKTIGSYGFEGCKNAMFVVDLPTVTSIGNSAFRYCSVLSALVVRSSTVCSLVNANALDSTPIASGTGYIYVPRALVDTYKAATNWSTYAAQFRALEDYTVDGTTTGELDESKI